MSLPRLECKKLLVCFLGRKTPWRLEPHRWKRKKLRKVITLERDGAVGHKGTHATSIKNLDCGSPLVEQGQSVDPGGDLGRSGACFSECIRMTVPLKVTCSMCRASQAPARPPEHASRRQPGATAWLPADQ